MEFKHKKNFSFEERQQQSQEILSKYRGRIPVICEMEPNAKFEVEIEKTKYLCPSDMCISQLSFLIRSKLKLTQEVSIYLLINGKTTIGGDETIQQLYQTFKDNDGFLYIAYSSEIIWG
jgi:hypothetical protein